jgi:hypothetical protein
MLINRIYSKVKTFVNTEVRGNVTPVEFNLFLHDALQERQNELISLINKHQNQANRGLLGSGLENLAENVREKLEHYLDFSNTTSNATGQITMPTNSIYIDIIENTTTSRFYEQCSNYNEFRILQKNAIADFPLSITFGSTIETFPVANTQNIRINFLRRVNTPNWTYTVTQGNELFNPSDANFRDCDAHPSEENILVLKVLQRFGINLKEQDLAAVATQDEIINDRKELMLNINQ